MLSARYRSLSVPLVPAWVVDALPQWWWRIHNRRSLPVVRSLKFSFARDTSGTPVRTIELAGRAWAWGRAPFDSRAAHRDAALLEERQTAAAIARWTNSQRRIRGEGGGRGFRRDRLRLAQELRFMADMGADPCLWIVRGPGPRGALTDPIVPIPPVLLSEIDSWLEYWQDNYYGNGDNWTDSADAGAWIILGDLLWARLNAELLPHGCLVWPDFEEEGPVRSAACTAVVFDRRRGAPHKQHRLRSDADKTRLVTEAANRILRHADLAPIELPRGLEQR